MADIGNIAARRQLALEKIARLTGVTIQRINNVDRDYRAMRELELVADAIEQSQEKSVEVETKSPELAEVSIGTTGDNNGTDQPRTAGTTEARRNPRVAARRGPGRGAEVRGEPADRNGD